MKRITTWALLMALVLSLFAGCGAAETPAAEPTNAPAAAPTDAVAEPVVTDEDLDNAIAYLKAFYKDVKSGTLTPADFERLGSVRIGLTAYEIVYTVDCDERDVKVVKGDNGMVTIDVNEESEEEVPYTLTATVTGTDGATASFSWEHILPVSMRGRATEIIDEAYALEEGAALSYEATLTGEIISIDTPYSADYKNITVSIKVEGREDKPIMCYRMKGEGCENLMPGDIITVSGIIKNYKGTIEFDAGCILKQAQKGENSVEIPDTEDGILKAAFDLKPGAYLPYSATLTGKVVGVGRYSPQYNNRTVSIICGDGYFIKCYRLKGENIDKVWMDDIITVTGNITNYDGTIEFDAGSIMDEWVDKPDPVPPTDPAEIVAAAYRLSNFSSLPYYCTLTGKVTYSSWNAVTRTANVDMIVEGKEITAYKMGGKGADAVKVGDTITVWGMLTNYWGTIEFDAGCKLIGKQGETVEDLYDLEPGETMEGEKVLTGEIISVEPGASSCNATIKVSGKEIYCPGMTGSGTDKLEKGDTVTVRGTLTNNGGTYQFKSGCKMTSWKNKNRPRVDASNTQAEIVAAAQQLGTADCMYGFILNGVITGVDTAYAAQYGNITVTMESQGVQIKCYRMKGDGVDKIGVGDTIRVKGDLINYNGSIQFASGCYMASYKKGEQPESTEKTPAEILEEAYALQPGESLPGTYTLTGTISNYSYSEGYNNADMILTVPGCEGKPIKCFRLTAKGISLLKNGDKITVTGSITNYNGTIEFAQGCTFTKSSWDIPADFASQYNYAKENLGNKDTLPIGTSFKAKVVSIDEAYSAQYKNITVTVKCGEVTIQCYRMKGGDGLSVGDTITVSGSIQMWYENLQISNGATYKMEAPAEPDVSETEPPTEPPVAPTDPTTPATVPPTPTTGEGEE